MPHCASGPGAGERPANCSERCGGLDILEQADWYESQADHRLAERWEKAVTATLLRIVKAPRSGPLCRFKTDELLDVRRTLVTGFPRHLIFYRFRDKELFILRVVHGARDLERLF